MEVYTFSIKHKNIPLLSLHSYIKSEFGLIKSTSVTIPTTAWDYEPECSHTISKDHSSGHWRYDYHSRNLTFMVSVLSTLRLHAQLGKLYIWCALERNVAHLWDIERTQNWVCREKNYRTIEWESVFFEKQIQIVLRTFLERHTRNLPRQPWELAVYSPHHSILIFSPLLALSSPLKNGQII